MTKKFRVSDVINQISGNNINDNHENVNFNQAYQLAEDEMNRLNKSFAETSISTEKRIEINSSFKELDLNDIAIKLKNLDDSNDQSPDNLNDQSLNKKSPLDIFSSKKPTLGVIVEELKDSRPSDIKKTDIDLAHEHMKESLTDIEEDLSDFTKRIVIAKKRLGLKEGGFKDEATNREFIYREPLMTDDELDQFLLDNFISIDNDNSKIESKYTPIEESSNTTVELVKDVQPAGDIIININTSDKDKLNFDNDLTSKIVKAKRIKVNVVESKDIRISGRKISSIDEINTDKTLSIRTVKITLPASRYTCEMTPLSFSEMQFINNFVNDSDLTKTLKLWKLFFKHILNPTIGKFSSMDDFMKKTAYIDESTLLIGLLQITYPDSQSLSITCNKKVWKQIPFNSEDYVGYNTIINEQIYDSFKPRRKLVRENNQFIAYEENTCGTIYDYDYNTSSLPDYGKLNKDVKHIMDKTISCKSLSEINQNYNNGYLNKEYIIVLPDTNYAIGMKIKSAYEILRDYYPYINNQYIKHIQYIAYESIKNKEYSIDNEDNSLELNNGNVVKFDEYIDNTSFEFMIPEAIEKLNSLLSKIIDIDSVDMIYMLSCISSIYILNKTTDEYDQCDNYQVIMELLKGISVADMKILLEVIPQFTKNYELTFSYKNCTCPKCGNVTSIPINDLKQLVFQLSRKGMDLEIEFNDIMKS